MEGRRRFAWGSRRELLPQALARTSLSRVFSPMHPAASINSNTSTRRIIGIDDGPFKPKRGANRGYAPLVAVWLQGPHLYKLKLGMRTVDGLDATNEALSLLDGSHGIPILLSGVTFGGFNLIDPRVVRQRCKASVIVVVGSKPDNRAVKRALVKHFPDWKRRWEIIRSLGPLRKARTSTAEPPIFFEALGCSKRDAVKLLISNCYISSMPESPRVAGLLARGSSTK